MEAAPLPRARMPYKYNEPRRHKIPKAKYTVSNWREYDQALQQRGSLTVWVTPEGDVPAHVANGRALLINDYAASPVQARAPSLVVGAEGAA